MGEQPAICEMGVDWDKDAERAAKEPYPYTEARYFEYFKEFIKPNVRVLEVGCQIGSWYPAWKGLEPTVKYEGLDFSSVAIKIARQRYPECKFHLMNAKQMNFKEEFDIVFTHTFLQHTSIQLKEKVMPLIWKALKKDGLLIAQENTACESLGTWFKEGWIGFIEKFGFQTVKTHDIGGGGTGFVFRKSA